MDFKNFDMSSIPYSETSMAYNFIKSYIDYKNGISIIKKNKFYNELCDKIFSNWNLLSEDTRDLMKLSIKITRVNSYHLRNFCSNLNMSNENDSYTQSILSIEKVFKKLVNLFKYDLTESVELRYPTSIKYIGN